MSPRAQHSLAIFFKKIYHTEKKNSTFFLLKKTYPKIAAIFFTVQGASNNVDKECNAIIENESTLKPHEREAEAGRQTTATTYLNR